MRLASGVEIIKDQQLILDELGDGSLGNIISQRTPVATVLVGLTPIMPRTLK